MHVQAFPAEDLKDVKVRIKLSRFITHKQILNMKMIMYTSLCMIVPQMLFVHDECRQLDA